MIFKLIFSNTHFVFITAENIQLVSNPHNPYRHVSVDEKLVYPKYNQNDFGKNFGFEIYLEKGVYQHVYINYNATEHKFEETDAKLIHAYNEFIEEYSKVMCLMYKGDRFHKILEFDFSPIVKDTDTKLPEIVDIEETKNIINLIKTQNEDRVC